MIGFIAFIVIVGLLTLANAKSKGRSAWWFLAGISCVGFIVVLCLPSKLPPPIPRGPRKPKKQSLTNAIWGSVKFLAACIAAFVAVSSIVGGISLFSFPVKSWQEGFDLNDLVLRTFHPHVEDPLYFLNSATAFAEAEIDFQGVGSFRSRQLPDGRWEHVEVRSETSSDESPLTKIISNSPHTNLSDEQFRSARQLLAEVFPDETQQAEFFAWGRSIANTWWAERGARIEEPIPVTDDEAAWFVRKRLEGEDPDFVRTAAEIVDRVGRRPDFPAARAWVSRLLDRYDSLPTEMGSEFDEKVEPEIKLPTKSTPPRAPWSEAWLIHRLIGSDAESQAALASEYASKFSEDDPQLALKWGRQLYDERLAAGEQLPEPTDSVLLYCAIERIRGLDPYGIRCRSVVREIFPNQFESIFVEIAVMTGMYPNDELYLLGAAGDPFGVTPFTTETYRPVDEEADDVFVIAFLRVFFWLVFIFGMRLLLFGFLGKLVLRLGDHPIFIDYHKRRKLKSRYGLWLLISSIVVPPLSALLVHKTLELNLSCLITFEELLWESYLVVWIGGAMFVVLNHLIALLLMARGVDPSRTWWDELISAPLAIGIMLFFQNDIWGVLGFLAFSLVPELAAKTTGKIEPDAPEPAAAAAADTIAPPPLR